MKIINTITIIKTRVILFSIATLFCFSSFATITKLSCYSATDNYYAMENTAVSIYKDRHGNCTFAINSLDSKNKYRSFTLTSQGHFFIFNVFDLYGSPRSATGARSYYILPLREKDLTLSFDSADHLIRITTPSHVEVHFDSLTTRIAHISHITWSEDRDVNRNNKGGVEISHPGAGIYLMDFGWRLGSDPRTLLTKKSKLLSAQKDCTTMTKNLLNFIYDSHGRIDRFSPRYPTQQLLEDFLSKRCP